MYCFLRLIATYPNMPFFLEDARDPAVLVHREGVGSPAGSDAGAIEDFSGIGPQGGA